MEIVAVDGERGYFGEGQAHPTTNRHQARLKAVSSCMRCLRDSCPCTTAAHTSPNITPIAARC